MKQKERYINDITNRISDYGYEMCENTEKYERKSYFKENSEF